MLFVIAGIIVTGIIITIIIYLRRHRIFEKNGVDMIGKITSTDSDCCGQHEVCERDLLLTTVSKKIDYYDDEELDIYSGTASFEYDEKAIDEFSEVLYTLRDEEVAGWLRSLQLRNINLPDRLKDEAFLIIEEQHKINH